MNIGITCKGCEGRLDGTQKHLSEHGINVTWMRGINGKVAGIKTAYPYDVDDPSGEYHIPSGHASLVINHWFAWQYANTFSKGSYHLFFEDDCRVVPGFNEYLDARMSELNALDPDWDFCYVGHLEGSTNPSEKGKCYNLPQGSIASCHSDPYGTHCYAVRPKALGILLDKCERIYANIDIAIWREAIPHLRHYAFIPPLANQQQDSEIYRNTLSESA